MTASKKHQAQRARDCQRAHNTLGLKTEAQQLQIGNCAGPFTQNSNFPSNSTKTVGGGQKSAVINQRGSKPDRVAEAGSRNHGTAGHGVCRGNHGDGKCTDVAASCKEGREVVGATLPGLCFYIESESDDDN